jgi:cell wall-associated NlpC family hydrolase
MDAGAADRRFSMYATRLTAVGAAAVVLALAAGGASRGPAVPQPFPTPGGPAAGAAHGTSSPASPDGSPARPPAAILAPTLAAQTIVDTAIRFVGTPYRNGGAAPDGFDCSGFVFYVFSQAGLAVPRTVEAQAHAGGEVGDLEPGDLVFFRTNGRGPTHVGIALGPDRFIHAPSSRGEVRIEPLARPYWAERYLEARRLF